MVKFILRRVIVVLVVIAVLATVLIFVPKADAQLAFFQAQGPVVTNWYF